MICFDIETEPLPREQLEAMAPEFDAEAAVPHPGQFDPSAVKTGNLKDKAKIDAKIADALRAHQERIANLDVARKAAAADHFDAFASKAALSAATGRVLAIGVHVSGFHNGGIELWTENEPNLIESFFALAAGALSRGESVVGHNIHGFDLPFLVRRAWVLGIDVPDGFFDGRNWNHCFVDTMRAWQLGARDLVSLDTLDKLFGGDGKPDGVTGELFHVLYHGSEFEREAALEYLRNDVQMVVRVASAMQLF